MNVLPSNTSLVSELKGAKLTIEIVPPTKGYTIKDIGDRKAIYDIATGLVVGEESYESYEAAKAAAEAMGLKRGYTNVGKMSATSDEARAENDIIGKALIESLSATPISKVRPASV
jgi:hypothetical protein